MADAPVGQDFDPLDGRGRDLAHVHEVLAAVRCVRTADGNAPAIDQDERVEVAQLNLGTTRGVLVGVRGVAGANVASPSEGRNALPQDVEHVGLLTGFLQIMARDQGNRHIRRVRRGGYIRAGNDEGIQNHRFVRGGGGGGRSLGQHDRTESGCEGGRSSGPQVAAELHAGWSVRRTGGERVNQGCDRES